ncbi:MAG: thioester reductase-like protein [Hyphomicrobiaceae bacterium]|jgi:thioester reductase-like protein
MRRVDTPPCDVPDADTSWLRERVAECLDLPTEDVDPRVPLFDYGLDSLSVVTLTEEIETRFGITNAGKLLGEECDIRSILRDARTSEALAEPARVDLRNDACLPTDIVPQVVRPISNPRAILLTGATGFVGSHVLRELLRATAVTIYCLVRASSRTDELQAMIGKDQRVRIVIGDLGEPAMGLSAAEFLHLTMSVDEVVHCGAAVDWVTQYPGLRRTNVGGTVEMLRFACHGNAKPVHFLSSLLVCYAAHAGNTGADRTEASDPLDGLDGLHLGYAQSKAVAESLVRQAAARGLPVVIHRPGLVTGHSESGHSNLGDITALLIRGCISMGAAPDLDLLLDGCPVDTLAKHVVSIGRHSPPRAGDVQTFHWTDLSKRNWRELVLWMNLYGHDVQLVPFLDWQQRLSQAILDVAHPLFGLRPFFLDRRAGRTNVEYFERQHRATVASPATEAWLARSSQRMPRLDPELLERYFHSYEQRGFLPSVPRQQPRAVTSSRVLVAELVGCSVEVVESLGPVDGDSIISDLSAWHGGSPQGLQRFRTPSGTMVLKRRNGDEAVLDVGRCVADLCAPGLGEHFVAHAACLGLLGAARREIEVYRTADARFGQFTPAVWSSRIDSDTDSNDGALLLEDIAQHDIRILDAADPCQWSREQLQAVLSDLAHLHAIRLDGSGAQARAAATGAFADANAMAAAAPLWTGLATHTAQHLRNWLSEDFVEMTQLWCDTIGEWCSELEAMPTTLIHGDFNTRNIALRLQPGQRPTLCAFDWELARPAVPQRDLVELLCFALNAQTSAAEIAFYVEFYRAALERASGVTLEGTMWRRGFQLALRDMAVCRVPLYGLVHRIRNQAYLERLCHTLQRLVQVEWSV